MLRRPPGRAKRRSLGAHRAPPSHSHPIPTSTPVDALSRSPHLHAVSDTCLYTIATTYIHQHETTPACGVAADHSICDHTICVPRLLCPRFAALRSRPKHHRAGAPVIKLQASPVAHVQKSHVLVCLQPTPRWCRCPGALGHKPCAARRSPPSRQPPHRGRREQRLCRP